VGGLKPPQNKNAMKKFPLNFFVISGAAAYLLSNYSSIGYLRWEISMFLEIKNIWKVKTFIFSFAFLSFNVQDWRRFCSLNKGLRSKTRAAKMWWNKMP